MITQLHIHNHLFTTICASPCEGSLPRNYELAIPWQCFSGGKWRQSLGPTNKVSDSDLVLVYRTGSVNH